MPLGFARGCGWADTRTLQQRNPAPRHRDQHLSPVDFDEEQARPATNALPTNHTDRLSSPDRQAPTLHRADDNERSHRQPAHPDQRQEVGKDHSRRSLRGAVVSASTTSVIRTP
jgi:hypothetical protein